MKIVCPQDELLAKLQIAARGVSQRSTVQILSGILLNATAGSGTELSATDMELSLRVPLEATVEEAGDVVLPGRLLLDIVRALPAADVVIDAAGGHRRRPARVRRPALLAEHPERRGLPAAAGGRPGGRSPSTGPRSWTPSATSAARPRRTSRVRC